MRREERVTVQGPVKEQQPDGMSQRGSRNHSSPRVLAGVAKKLGMCGLKPAPKGAGFFARGRGKHLFSLNLRMPCAATVCVSLAAVSTNVQGTFDQFVTHVSGGSCGPYLTRHIFATCCSMVSQAEVSVGRQSSSAVVMSSALVRIGCHATCRRPFARPISRCSLGIAHSPQLTTTVCSNHAMEPGSRSGGWLLSLWPNVKAFRTLWGSKDGQEIGLKQ